MRIWVTGREKIMMSNINQVVGGGWVFQPLVSFFAFCCFPASLWFTQLSRGLSAVEQHRELKWLSPADTKEPVSADGLPHAHHAAQPARSYPAVAEEGAGSLDNHNKHQVGLCRERWGKGGSKQKHTQVKSSYFSSPMRELMPRNTSDVCVQSSAVI